MMTTDHTYYFYTDEERRAAADAMTRIQNILNAKAYVVDATQHIIPDLCNDVLEDAQIFIRCHLDADVLPETLTENNLRTHWGLEHLTVALAQLIANDLRLIWSYEFFRDDISHIAMTLSLCPMHFCDWASCFDDDDEECAQIRAIFPHHHDT